MYEFYEVKSSSDYMGRDGVNLVESCSTVCYEKGREGLRMAILALRKE